MAFELFLCNRHVAAAVTVTVAAAADINAVDYNIMLPVTLDLLPPMDRVLLLLCILYLSMIPLPPLRHLCCCVAAPYLRFIHEKYLITPKKKEMWI